MLSYLKFTFMVVLLWSFSVFAQTDLSQPVADLEFMQLILTSVGGMKGASTLAIVAGVIQILMALFRTRFISGKYKLMTVYLLSLLGGVIGLKMQGLSLGAAFLHANSLAALQVLGNQAYKQFLTKKG